MSHISESFRWILNCAPPYSLAYNLTYSLAYNLNCFAAWLRVI